MSISRPDPLDMMSEDVEDVQMAESRDDEALTATERVKEEVRGACDTILAVRMQVAEEQEGEYIEATHVYQGMLYLAALMENDIETPYGFSIDDWLVYWLMHHQDSRGMHSRYMADLKNIEVSSSTNLLSRIIEARNHIRGTDKDDTISAQTLLFVASSNWPIIDELRTKFTEATRQLSAFTPEKEVLMHAYPSHFDTLPVQPTLPDPVEAAEKSTRKARKPKSLAHVDTRIGTLHRSPQERFFEQQNSKGNDYFSPLTDNGAPMKSNRRDWSHCCALKLDGKAPAKVADRLGKLPIEIQLSPHSQLPGGVISALDSKSAPIYKIAFTPQCCKMIELETIESSASEKNPRAKEVLDEWVTPDHNLHELYNGKGVNLCLITFTVEHKDNCRPVLSHYDHRKAQTNLISVSHEDILKANVVSVLIDFTFPFRQLQAARWWKHTIDLQYEDETSREKSWALYRRTLEFTGSGDMSLAALLDRQYKDEKTYPRVPVHLYQDAKNENSTPSIIDITAKESFSEPIYSSFGDITNALVLGSYREMQHTEAEYTFAKRVRHSVQVQLVELPPHGRQVFRAVVQVNGQFDVRLLPEIGSDLRLLLFPMSVDQRQLKLDTFIERSAKDGGAELVLRFSCFDDDVEGRMYHLVQSGYELQAEIVVIAPIGAYKRQIGALKWAQMTANRTTGEFFHPKQMFIEHREQNKPTINIQQDFEESLANATDLEAVRGAVNHLLSNLNKEQLAAVEASLNNTIEGLIRLSGPPGTGKSFTLAKMIVASILLHCQLTAAAKTNVAVNILLDKVLKMLEEPDIQAVLRVLTIVRIQPFKIEDLIRSTMVVNKRSESVEREQFSLACVTYRKAITGEHAEGSPLYDYALWIKHIEQFNGQASKIPLDEWNKYLSCAKAAESEVLSTADAVFATVDTLAAAYHSSTLHYQGASSAFFDEVSQMTVPDWLQAIARNQNCKRVVIAGDGKQLNPNPASHASHLNECGELYAMSLFNHSYVKLLEGQHFRLRQNYRNKATIVDLSNQISQNDETDALIATDEGMQDPCIDILLANQDALKEQVRVFEDFDFRRMDLCYIHVEAIATETTADSNPQRCARYQIGAEDDSSEIKVQLHGRTGRYSPKVIEVIKQMGGALVSHGGIKQSQISNLSTYNWDAELLETAMATDGYVDIKTATVDKYQGDENEIIFINLVSLQKNAWRYVGNRERLNVALTRGKAFVIIVGNFAELREAATAYNGPTAIRTLTEFLIKRKLILNYDLTQRADMSELPRKSTAAPAPTPASKRPRDDRDAPQAPGSKFAKLDITDGTAASEGDNDVNDTRNGENSQLRGSGRGGRGGYQNRGQRGYGNQRGGYFVTRGGYQGSGAPRGGSGSYRGQGRPQDRNDLNY